MGIETALVAMGMSASTAATVGTIATAVSAGSSLLSGVQQLSAGKSQAEGAYAQAGANIAEQTRQSTQQAYQEKQAAEGARRQQKLAYLKSGVSLSGSPLMVLEETRQKGLANANAVKAANTAYTTASGVQAKYQAKDAISQGRMGFIKGVTGALSNYAN